MSLSLLKIFFSVSKIQNRRACSLLFNSKNLLFNRNISLKNVRNIKTKKEFDDNLFEELYGFKFKKQLTREEIKQKILEIIKRQPSINQELIKEKGLNAWFTSLGINNSKRKLFDEICNEFDVQLPLSEYDNIQTGLDICEIVCDLVNAKE